MALVAVLPYEFGAGDASRGILVSVAVELLLAADFARSVLQDRRVAAAT
ncbi:MAG TPA: hypothetical protein VHL79_14145 [Ramlibacter sp.]|jgi:hypothetical protein|nr:hypothetical protein [Ramlibacter sp.]